MNEDHEKKLRSIVNASGYLFQLRVADEVSKSTKTHGWYVASFEHPWRDKESGREGFIDIVLKRQNNPMLRVVIECKRPLDGIWVFLVDEHRGERITECRCLSTYHMPPEEPRANWNNLRVDPGSSEAVFCAVRGKGEGDKPMLERICGQLLDAVDCLAVQEFELDKWSVPTHPRRFYFPAIVTSAQIVVCRFDTSKVSLENGKMPEGKFQDVPFVRFTKSLATELNPEAPVQSLEQVAKELKRTVLVIQASALSKVLSDWHLDSSAYVR